MKQKSHHQHLKEEREEAARLLDIVKNNEENKVKIYLNDRSHTVFIVKRGLLGKKLALLEKEGKIIQRIL